MTDSTNKKSGPTIGDRVAGLQVKGREYDRGTVIAVVEAPEGTPSQPKGYGWAILVEWDGRRKDSWHDASDMYWGMAASFNRELA